MGFGQRPTSKKVLPAVVGSFLFTEVY